MKPTRKEIALSVCQKWELAGLEELRQPSRKRFIAHIRQEAMYLMNEAGYSLGQIGSFFGFDHSTVLAGIRNHKKRNSPQ